MVTISVVRRLTLHIMWTLLLMNRIQVHGSDIEFVVQEEQPKGTYVGSVAERSKVANDVSAEEFSLLKYSFLYPPNSQANALFRIDNDGKVYTTRRIDREAICENSLKCEREVDVTIRSSVSSLLRIYGIKFIIADINDNEPTFSTDVITLYIPESAIVGTKYAIEGAVDKDTGANNSIQSYELLKPNKAFGIESERKLDGSSIVKIVLLKRLNRENRDLYNFFVLAKDGGHPQKTGSVTINVNVRDVNDNKPIFRRKKYEFEINENTRANAIIGRVKAIDKDIGENGRVSYRFSPLRSGRLEELLSINPVSGELTVNSALQYESGKSYNTIVEATDNGNPPQVSQAALYVKIIDTGNNPPKLELNLVASPVNADTILLSEGSKIDFFVGHIKVEDRDPGLNGVVICRSVNPFFHVKKLDGNGYALMTSKALDREEEDKHKVDVICEDSGTPRLSSHVSFNVMVTDINDVAPKFLRSTYHTNVSENVGIGVEVTRVKAIDLDLGVNSQFIYQLNWDSNSMFNIDYDTGIITTNAVFDRETMSQVKFTVKAVDQGKTSLVGTTTVIVDILDVNDNTPFIDPESLKMEVREDIPIGGDIGHLIGKDLDAGKNARLDFRLTDNDPRIPFVVFADGTVRTTRQLDRETLDHYEFDVTVSDNGDYPLSSSGHVRVNLLDVNDNHPVIEFPNSDNDSVIVVSDLAPGSIVAKIMAYDDDLRENAELSYSLAEGNTQSMFKVLPKSGEVVLARRITADDSERLLLKVSVQDLGSPQLEKRQNLEIKIRFTNATLAERQPEVYGYKYVIIVGVVAGITIIVSVIIVVAIIKLRRPNGRFGNNERNVVQEQGDHTKGDEKEALKTNSPKRVILATTESDNNFEFFTNPKLEKDPKFTMTKSADGNIYDAAPGSDQYGKQEFLTFKKSKLPIPNDDIRSNSSGETASDSGKGASEDEIHLTILAGGDGSYRKCQVSLSPDFEDFLPPPPYCFAEQADPAKGMLHISTYPKPRAPKREGPSTSLHNISKYSKDHKQIPGTVGHTKRHPIGGSNGKPVYKPTDADISEYPTIELSKIKSVAKGYPF